MHLLNKHQKLLVLTLTLATFAMGTSEFIIVGLLTNIVQDLHISIPKGGTLISYFALAYAIGTPIFAALLSRYNKHKIILILLSIFIMGNIISALASSYLILILARILTAIVSGVLIAFSMGITTSTMPKSKQAAIISLIFAGFAVANVIGVPLGTFIGQISSWRMTFALTALLGLITLILSFKFIPKSLEGSESSLLQQLSLLKDPRILMTLLIPIFGAGGTFTLYTYISPFLEEILTIPTRFTSIILLAFGIFAIGSNIISSKIASKNGLHQLRYIFIIQAFVLYTLYWTQSSAILALINLMVMALLFYAMNATVQIYFMTYAEKKSPEYKDFAASLTPVAINIGIFVGSITGSYVISFGGLQHLSWVGGIEVLCASVLTFTILWLEKYGRNQEISFAHIETKQ